MQRATKFRVFLLACAFAVFAFFVINAVAQKPIRISNFKSVSQSLAPFSPGSYTCFDSDADAQYPDWFDWWNYPKGLNPFAEGKVLVENGESFFDNCEPETSFLLENYCEADGSAASEIVICEKLGPYFCDGGKCAVNSFILSDLAILNTEVEILNANGTTTTFLIHADIINSGYDYAKQTLTRFKVAPVSSFVHTSDLLQGESVSISANFAVPSGSNVTATINADWNDVVFEGNETNNEVVLNFTVS